MKELTNTLNAVEARRDAVKEKVNEMKKKADRAAKSIDSVGFFKMHLCSYLRCSPFFFCQIVLFVWKKIIK